MGCWTIGPAALRLTVGAGISVLTVDGVEEGVPGTVLAWVAFEVVSDGVGDEGEELGVVCVGVVDDELGAEEVDDVTEPDGETGSVGADGVVLAGAAVTWMAR